MTYRRRLGVSARAGTGLPAKPSQPPPAQPTPQHKQHSTKMGGPSAPYDARSCRRAAGTASAAAAPARGGMRKAGNA